MTVTARRRATNQNTGMTLDELASLVTSAMRLNLPGTTPVRGICSWKQVVLHLEMSGTPIDAEVPR